MANTHKIDMTYTARSFDDVLSGILLVWGFEGLCMVAGGLW